MEDDFAFRYARIYPGVNSRAELVTLVPGLRPERRFAPLARGLIVQFINDSTLATCTYNTVPSLAVYTCGLLSQLKFIFFCFSIKFGRILALLRKRF